MLIKQNNKLELRGPGPPGRTYPPTANYFPDQTILQAKSSSSELLFTAKNTAEGKVPYCFPHLDQITYKI